MLKCISLLFLFVLFGISEIGFLEETFALDPQLKSKAHEVKMLEIKEEKSDIDKIWSLRENPKIG